MCVAVQSLLLSCRTETVPTRHSVSFYLPQPLAPTILLSVNMKPTDLRALYFPVYVTEHNALGFIQAVACVRTAFLSGWTTFIVWTDHGLLVHSSVEGHREYLHSSLTSCNICGITSESPMMIQKSFTINYFINFFILKPIKAEKKGRMHVSFTCV